MSENPSVKEAFTKVKEDIESLRYYLSVLQLETEQIKTSLESFKNQSNRQTDRPAHSQNLLSIEEIREIIAQTVKETIKTELKTISDIQKLQISQQIPSIEPTQTPKYPTIQQTDNYKLPLYSPISQNIPFSTGNGGVPADRQTVQQTDRQSQMFAQPQQTLFPEDKISNLQKVSDVIESLDTLKKEIRAQFKRLTNQEMLIFSAIYQLDEQGIAVDYSILASKTGLTESSIRDYTQKLIKKNIPILKNKENNKKVTLEIDPNFKKIAPLNTLIALRSL